MTRGVAHGRPDALFTWARARMGRWYFDALIALLSLFVCLLVIPLLAISQVPLWTGHFARWRYVVAFVLLAVLWIPGIMALVLHRRHFAVVSYLRGEEVDPAEVWNAAVLRVPASALIVTLVWSAVVMVPAVVFTGIAEGFNTATLIGAVFGGLVLACGAGALSFLLLELGLVPVAREVAELLPAEFSGLSWMTMGRRLALIISSAAMSAGGLTAGFVYGFDRRWRPWATVDVTLALVLTYIGLIVALVSFNVIRRIDEITGAFNRVGSERSARVLPSFGDDFDVFGQSFNQMVSVLETQSAELRASRARIVALSDDTRRQLERDLHDGAQQHLAVVGMHIARLERMTADRPELSACVEPLRGMLGGVADLMRTLARGIYPAELESDGITAALQSAQSLTRVPVRIRAGGLSEWPASISAALYFCCWEMVQLAERSGSERASVQIQLAEADDHVWFEFLAPHVGSNSQPDFSVFFEDRIGAVGGTVEIGIDQWETLTATGTVPLP